jgi:hypothetical protein
MLKLDLVAVVTTDAIVELQSVGQIKLKSTRCP